MEIYSFEEISKHNSEDDAWIVINNNVYDITYFLEKHPGGKSMLLNVAGTDATDFFEALHQPKILEEYGEEYKIGVCE